MRLPLTCLAFLPALVFAQSPPSAADLIHRAIAAGQAQVDRGAKYTYREDETRVSVDKKGKAGQPVTRTYDHIMLEGSNYRKLILVEGRPLDAKTQRKVEEDLARERDQRRKNTFFHRNVNLVGLDLMERVFENRFAGEETIGGHATWRLESEPKAGFKPSTTEETDAAGTRRTTWLNQEDGAEIMRRDTFVKAVNGFQPGSFLDVQLMQLGQDWVMDKLTLIAELKIAMFRGRGETHQRYYDYKRFTVDSTITTE